MKRLVCPFLTYISCISTARLSRECGELRIRLEKSETELAKVSGSSKHESARIKSVLADVWKHLENFPVDTTKHTGQKIPNESLSSEISRLEQRIAFIANALSDSGIAQHERRTKERDTRIKELEDSVREKEDELKIMSMNFSEKLIDMKTQIELLTTELESVKFKQAETIGEVKSSKKLGLLPPPKAS